MRALSQTLCFTRAGLKFDAKGYYIGPLPRRERHGKGLIGKKADGTFATEPSAACPAQMTMKLAAKLFEAWVKRQAGPSKPGTSQLGAGLPTGATVALESSVGGAVSGSASPVASTDLGVAPSGVSQPALTSTSGSSDRRKRGQSPIPESTVVAPTLPASTSPSLDVRKRGSVPNSGVSDWRTFFSTRNT